MHFLKEPTVSVLWHSRVIAADFINWSMANHITLDGGTPIRELYKRIPAGDQTLDDLVEFAGRHCYRSWFKGRSNEEYIQNILESGHGSVLEHANITFAISGVSRSLTHELVRHRAGFAFSQESQRFVDMEDVNIVVPPALVGQMGFVATTSALMQDLGQIYKGLQNLVRGNRKTKNQVARCIMPNMAETRIVVTTNLRALRHFLELRGSLHADDEIRRLAIAMFEVSYSYAPLCLSDIEVQNSSDIDNAYLTVKYSKI